MSAAGERLSNLLDKGSFQRMDDLEPTIHLLGRGTVGGRTVYCCAGLSDVRGADVRECFLRKVNWLEYILDHPAPVVWLHDAPPPAPGGRTPIPAGSADLIASPTGVGRVFCLQARLHGVVPQFSVLFGDAGAAQSFPVRLADFTLLKRGTHLWIGRPDAVKLMLGEGADAELLGGADMHCRVSGVGDVLFEEDHQALQWITRCLSLLPSRSGKPVPHSAPRPPLVSGEELASCAPTGLNTPFAMQRIVDAVIDAESWVAIQQLHAGEVITGLARVAGIPVGIVANNAEQRGGLIFPETCRKMNRFVTFCNRYRIPLLFLVDNPGLMVGSACEQAGMLREASELLITLATITVPRVCLVVRKAYTVGLYVMSGPGFEPTCFWAASQASIAIFGPKALDYFAADREVPDTARDAILEMRRYAVDPENYLHKGYLDAIVAFTDLRAAMETFVQDHAGRTGS